MKIRDVLSIELFDDATSDGGISHEGEKVYEFLADTDLNLDDDVSKLNEVLIGCGIMPIEDKSQDEEIAQNENETVKNEIAISGLTFDEAVNKILDFSEEKCLEYNEINKEVIREYLFSDTNDKEIVSKYCEFKCNGYEGYDLFCSYIDTMTPEEAFDTGLSIGFVRFDKREKYYKVESNGNVSVIDINKLWADAFCDDSFFNHLYETSCFKNVNMDSLIREVTIELKNSKFKSLVDELENWNICVDELDDTYFDSFIDKLDEEDALDMRLDCVFDNYQEAVEDAAGENSDYSVDYNAIDYVDYDTMYWRELDCEDVGRYKYIATDALSDEFLIYKFKI